MIYENEYMSYDSTTNVLNVKDVIKVFYREIQNTVLRKESDDRIVTVLQRMQNYRVVLPDCIERLCDNAFDGGINMSAINLPNGITYIGDAAFRYCFCLKNIIWPTGTKCIKKYTFYKCESLEEVVLPEGLTTICDFAFCNCEVLKNITIPSTVQDFGVHIFDYCDSLETIEVPRSLYEKYNRDDNYFKSKSSAEVVVYDGSSVELSSMDSERSSSVIENEIIVPNTDILTVEDVSRTISSKPKVETRSFNGVIRTNLIANKKKK